MSCLEPDLIRSGDALVAFAETAAIFFVPDRLASPRRSLDLPAVGTRILTRKGQGRVLSQEILARKVLAEFEDGRRVIVAADEILTKL